MTQHNIVHLLGVVCTLPTVRKNEDGEAVSAVVSIACYASGMRKFEGATTYSNDEVCQVQIQTGDPNRAAQIEQLRMYDIIYIKGTVNTRNVRRFLTCENCGERFQIEKKQDPNDDAEKSDNKEAGSMITFVTPIVIDVRNTSFGDRAASLIRNANSGFFDDYGNEDKAAAEHNQEEIRRIENEACKFVLERRELSNEVQVIGNLCADPKTWHDGDAPATSYQLGINRRFYLTDDAPSAKSDYPFIRSYGTQADNDIEALSESSLVLVDGFLKRRYFRRESICPNCGKTKLWKGSVLEIVPYAVQYLAGYTTKEEREKASKETTDQSNQMFANMFHFANEDALGG